MGCGGSQLDRKQTLPHIRQADRQYNVRFAAEVFQFAFEPTPLSETTVVYFVLPKKLQQQSD